MAETTTEQPAAPEKVTNGHAVENGTNDKSHYKMPDSKTLEEAGKLPIKDENDAEIEFSSLYTDKPGERQLIVFIRHFYCGHCEEYVRYLSKHLSPSTLASSTPPTKLTIIGCGSTDNIAAYRTRTGCPFPIYTDPTRNLYDKLNMVVTLSPGAESNKPEYLSVSVGQSVVSSFKNMVFGGAKGMKGGKFSQNGGEWIFEGGELKWVRRMRGTADHALVAELREMLGMSPEEKTGE